MNGRGIPPAFPGWPPLALRHSLGGNVDQGMQGPAGGGGGWGDGARWGDLGPRRPSPSGACARRGLMEHRASGARVPKLREVKGRTWWGQVSAALAGRHL